MNPEHFVDPAHFEDETLGVGDDDNMVFHDDDDAIGAMSRHTLTDREFKQLVASLNTKQRIPFDIVV